MMARQQVEAHAGEYGFYFKFYLKDAFGAVVTTLAGTETISLWFKEPGEDAFQVGSGSVNDTDTGEIYVSIAVGDALTAGTYAGQVEILSDTSLLITIEVDILIRRRLGS